MMPPVKGKLANADRRSTSPLELVLQAPAGAAPQVAPVTHPLLGLLPETILELPAYSLSIIATSSDDALSAAAS
jgi:hypothetical protein